MTQETTTPAGPDFSNDPEFGAYYTKLRQSAGFARAVKSRGGEVAAHAAMAYSVLSDAQELLERNPSEAVSKEINRAKFLLDVIMERSAAH